MSGREVHHPDGMDPSVYGLADVVRVGGLVFVSGQTAYEPDVEPGDMAAQMRVAYGKVGAALARVGCSMADVVDETLFVTDTLAAVTAGGAVRAEVYGGRFEMASTLVEVRGLAAPGCCIEIKCIAVPTAGRGSAPADEGDDHGM